VVALNGVRNLEARKLIKEGHFITEELDELVGVADAFACRHRGTYLDAFIQGFQSFIATAGPDFGETCLDWIVDVFFSIIDSFLKIGDT
jgi:hypothetical protein